MKKHALFIKMGVVEENIAESIVVTAFIRRYEPPLGIIPFSRNRKIHQVPDGYHQLQVIHTYD